MTVFAVGATRFFQLRAGEIIKSTMREDERDFDLSSCWTKEQNSHSIKRVPFVSLINVCVKKKKTW